MTGMTQFLGISRIDWTFHSLGFWLGGILVGEDFGGGGDIVRGDFVWRDFGSGGFCPRGILSGRGFVRGVFVQGDFVRGDFVLSPITPQVVSHFRLLPVSSI